MKNTDPPPALQTRRPDWIAAALGTISVATLIAAAAVGTYVTIIGGQGNFASLADRTVWAVGIFLSLIATLGAYLFVVAAGMNTVFTADDQQRHSRVKTAAVGFYFQVIFVICFALLLTLAVFTHDLNLSTAVGQTDQAPCCPELCSSENMSYEDNQFPRHQHGDRCR